MRPDILFIHPNASEVIYQDLSREFSAIEPPIWAGMLAKHCQIMGYNAEIMDCEAINCTDDHAIIHINNMKPRLVAFVIYGQQPSASSQNMEGAIRLAEKIKLDNPEKKILFVGGHVSALPGEVLQKHSCVDFVCQNEGVYTISTLLKTDLLSQLNTIQGLAFRKGDAIYWNKPSAIVPKNRLAEDLPGVAWDRLPMNLYRTSLWHSLSNNTERQPFASLYTSLGCPFRCSFCMINIINRQENEYSDGSNIFRFWDPNFIIKDFEYFAKNNIKNIKIADEMFVLNPNHFLKLCELIIERRYNFNIWAYARIDTVKDKYLETLKRAGVNWLALGIESGNMKVRSDVIKGQFKEINIRDIVKKIQDHGINVMGNYIFGLPEDTMESMQDTLDLALELNTEGANFYSAMAYPGSPLYGIAKKNNWKLPETYAGYSQHSYYTQPIPSKHLTPEQILKFRDEAWEKYHTNPDYLTLLENKFGDKAVDETVKSTNIKLKRKILGD